MSAIFGAVLWDRAGLDERRVGFERAVAAKPFGRVRTWSADGCLLGSALVDDTPESGRDVGPRFIADRALAVVAEARLDDRDALCDALELGPSERRDTADADLLIHAYLRWGEDAFE